MKKLDQQVGSQDELPRSTRTSVKEAQVPRNGKEDEPQVSRSIQEPSISKKTWGYLRLSSAKKPGRLNKLYVFITILVLN